MLKGKRVRILAMAVVLALVVLAVIGCGSSGPTSAVENFMSAAKDKDCDKMVDLIDLKAMEDSGIGITKDELITSCKEESGLGDVVSYKVIEEKVDGDKATVKVEVTTTEDGKDVTNTDTLTVNKRDGDWKISLM